MMMDEQADPQRLSNWLAELASTEPEEIDCDALTEALEAIAAVADSTLDIRDVLPSVAVHMEHCPECRDVYESLRAFSRELDEG